jgi:hypothetical protein
MTLPKKFEDWDGNSITVNPGRDTTYAFVTVFEPDDDGNTIQLDSATLVVALAVRAEDIDPLYAALREAVGRPEPVVLDAPDRSAQWRRMASTSFGSFKVVPGGVQRNDGGAVDPASVREIAAVLAVMADEAEAQPDPEDVKALREWFQELEFAGKTCEDIARAFLEDWQMPEEREV